MAGGDKASFLNVDQKTTFTLQFNPKEFSVEETASWKDSDEFQQQDPQLTYDRNKPATIKMDLIFDTTDSGEDVHDTWVKNIRSFLSVEEEDKEPTEHKVVRPPYLKFTWGKFDFDCVCEAVSSSFLMFKADGTPLRAKVTLTLKGRRQVYKTAANSVDPLKAMASMMQGSGTAKEKPDAASISGAAGASKHKSSSEFTKTYKSQPGETISDVANKTGVHYSLIAAANGKNPLDEAPAIVILPASAVMASVFEHLNKSESPAEWGDFTPNLNPDSVPGDDWNIDKGDYEHGVSEGQIEFSNYSSEHTYGAENEIDISETYGGPVEKTDIVHGDSQKSDDWGIDKNGPLEHEYGADNEASFSDGYGGETEKNEYTQGDSASSDDVDISKNDGADFKYGEENKAEFSDANGDKVDATEYSSAEGGAADDMDITKNEGGGQTSAAENKAEFSGTKSGDVKAGTAEHGDSDLAAGGMGGKASASKDSASASGPAGSGATTGGAKGGGEGSAGASGSSGGEAKAASSDSGASAGSASKDSAGSGGKDSPASSGGSEAKGGASASSKDSGGASAKDSGGASAKDSGGASGKDSGGASGKDSGGASGKDSGGASGKDGGAAAASKDSGAAGDSAGKTDAKAGGASSTPAPKGGGAAGKDAAAGAKTSDVASETSRTDSRTKFTPGSNPGDSKMTKGMREVDQGVAGAEKVAKDLDKALDAPGKAQKELIEKAKTIAAKGEMHADRITNETTEATD